MDRDYIFLLIRIVSDGLINTESMTKEQLILALVDGVVAELNDEEFRSPLYEALSDAITDDPVIKSPPPYSDTPATSGGRHGLKREEDLLQADNS